MTELEPTPPAPRDAHFQRRLRWFAAVVALLIAGASAYLYARHSTATAHRWRQSTERSSEDGRRGPGPTEERSADGGLNANPTATASPVLGPRVFFRDLVDAGGAFGKIAFLPLGEPRDAAPSALRVSTDVPCVRSYFAAGRGLCIRLAKNAFHRAEAIGLDATFGVTFTLPLNGLPSRVRLSHDGAYGATTIFVTGHGYDDADMSTQTNIVDMKGGRFLHDLEDFALLKEGQKVNAVDRNYWGVTFQRAPGRFYATVSTGGTPWLVEGDIDKKELRMLAENVECPSLSPDEKRIAYKRRTDSLGRWRLHVMDVATRTPRPLAETRNIDDQVEWLDDRHLLYKQGTDVWSLDVDADAPAVPFVTRAASPSVERPEP